MVEVDAVLQISEIVGNDVLSLQALMTEIDHAPRHVRRFLSEQLRSLDQLEKFLNIHNDRFTVENGKVVMYDEELEDGREGAVTYFENELNLNNGSPPHYMNFRGHIGQAEYAVIDFINTFYPHEEFKDFLLAHPDIFVVFDDDTVSLIENECVDYFEKCLEEDDGLYFMNLQGHIGQAPKHVIEFINTYYPGEQFLEFLQNNLDAFDIDDGYVYLSEDN